MKTLNDKLNDSLNKKKINLDPKKALQYTKKRFPISFQKLGE